MRLTTTVTPLGGSSVGPVLRPPQTASIRPRPNGYLASLPGVDTPPGRSETIPKLEVAHRPLGGLRSVLPALWRTARPRQWAKNVLIAAAPIAAGAASHDQVLWRTLAAFVAFCLVSSGTYFLNDASDVEADRSHPVKRDRPIAAGLVSVRLALRVGLACLAGGLAVGFMVNWQFGAIVGGYVALTGAYTFRLKQVPVLDIVIVAAGFFIRAMAGGLATDIPISRWFAIVTGFGPLYMVAGKRYAELVALGPDAARARSTLAAYTKGYLTQIMTIAGGVTILAFCLWAFEGRAGHPASTWTTLSIIPVVIAIMRYGLLIEQGHGEEPEEIVLGDRQLQILALAFLVLFVIGVYL